MRIAGAYGPDDDVFCIVIYSTPKLPRDIAQALQRLRDRKYAAAQRHYAHNIGADYIVANEDISDTFTEIVAYHSDCTLRATSLSVKQIVSIIDIL